MIRAAQIVFAASAFMALSGCMSSLTTGSTYPVLDDTPNPAPVRGYRVRCYSTPGLTYVLDPGFNTSCDMLVPPPGDVVRARG